VFPYTPSAKLQGKRLLPYPHPALSRRERVLGFELFEFRLYRVSRRIAMSSPSSVSPYMRSSMSWRTMPIEPVPDQ
jgi:hypothetical protein